MFRRAVSLLLSSALVASLGLAPAGRAADADPRLEQLRQQLVQLGREQQAGESVSEAWRLKLLELNARQADLDRRMGANRDSQVQMMAALQLMRRNPPPALLVNPRSARDAVRAAILMQAVLPALEARRRDYVAEANELDHIRRDAAVAGAALLSAESAEADRRARIDQLVTAKSGLEQPEDAGAIARARAAAAKASSMGELIGNLAHADPGAQTPPAATPPATPAETPAPVAGGALAGSGAFHMSPPVHGRLVRRYGASIAKAGGDARRSTGVAWRTEPAATVLSPADAVVDYAGDVKGLGLVLILRVSGDYRVVMGGLDKVSALTGRRLVAGEPVGRMPQTSAPELFLEVRRAEQTINPSNFFR